MSLPVKITLGVAAIALGVILVPIALEPLVSDVLPPPEGPAVTQKDEWSVLQSIEVAHRNAEQTAPALIVRNALQSDFTAIGFPARNRSAGYVWLLANPTTKPCIKQMPTDWDFVISTDVLDWIKRQTPIDPRVKAYLESSRRHVIAWKHTASWGREGCRA